jgi:hypothetical protein
MKIQNKKVTIHDFPFIDVKTQNDPFKVVREHRSKMKSQLVTPSRNHSYSLCIEYVKEWFDSAFYDNFFKSKYINGSHVIDQFRRLTREQLLKRNTPCYTITPSIDYDYNSEMVDLYPYGANIFNNRYDIESSFYRNFETNDFIALDFKQVLMKFNFRIKMPTLASAQDLYDFMQIKFRAGATMGREVDLDFHLPIKLMAQVAVDNGFELDENGYIKDTTAFLSHMNKNSVLPIMYKRRNGVGHLEYFLKVPKLYVHFRISDIQIDEGERQGHIMNNFGLQFDVDVHFPCPKFFVYFFFENKEFLQTSPEESDVITLEDFPVLSIPKTNDKGWNQFITTEYVDDQENFDNKVPLTISFIELIGDIRKVIDYTKSIYLSPGLFVDMKLFNNGKEIPLEVDWDTYEIKTNTVMNNIKSHLVLYVDNKYLNETIMKLREDKKNRITPYMQSKIVRN